MWNWRVMSYINVPNFWRDRILKLGGSDVHKILYDVTKQEWDTIQNLTKKIIAENLKEGEILLDVGCGYGAVCEVLGPTVKYLGVDVSQDMLKLARKRNPNREFLEADVSVDLKNYPNNHFGMCLVRSVVSAFECGNILDSAQRELSRLCKVVIRQEYTRSKYEIVGTRMWK